MIRITTLLLLLATTLFFASCKPGDDLNPTPTNLISGYLISSRLLDLDSPATKYTEQAQAVFYKHPGDSTLRVAVDSVKVNGHPLPMDNVTMLYKTSGNLQMDNCTWQVYSTTNIASFAYNFSAPYPLYTTPMPDTIDRAGGATITLPMTMDSASITLRANSVVYSVYKGASGFLSPTQMSGLNAGPALLEVSGYKATTQAFGGKNFRFIKQTTKMKAVWLN